VKEVAEVSKADQALPTAPPRAEAPPADEMSAGGAPARPSVRDRIEGRWFPYLMVMPTLAVLTLVGVIPFVYTIWISLHETSFTTVLGFSGITNFRELLTDPLFWRGLWVTGVILAVAVPLQLLTGLGLALVFHRGVLGSRFISPALLLPAVVAPTVVAIIWKIMLAGTWGLLTFEVIDRFQLIRGGSVFGLPRPALLAIILIDVWQWTPFVALALFAGLQALPIAPYRAAAVDGASRWQVFRYVTLPMLSPLLAVLLLLRILDTFKIFDTVFVLTGGGPGDATQVISLYLYKGVFHFWELGRAAAAAVLIFVMFFVFASVLYRLFSRRLMLF
jgi:multiple sugar transport system permease protein